MVRKQALVRNWLIIPIWADDGQTQIDKELDKTQKIILGVDPGTNVMGYGVIKVVGNTAQMVAMGIIDLRKIKDPYLRLGKIFDRITGIIDEYLPDEMAITGQGQASKEQVADMLQRLLKLDRMEMPKFMDATDALGAAYCHFMQMKNPSVEGKHYRGWKDFVAKNPTRSNL